MTNDPYDGRSGRSVLPNPKEVVVKTVVKTIEVVREVVREIPPDPNPRCSCKCGCDRKMPEDKFKRVCDPCALGIHLEKEEAKEKRRAHRG